jgi:hypothetical protein
LIQRAEPHHGVDLAVGDHGAHCGALGHVARHAAAAVRGELAPRDALVVRRARLLHLRAVHHHHAACGVVCARVRVCVCAVGGWGGWRERSQSEETRVVAGGGGLVGGEKTKNKKQFYGWATRARAYLHHAGHHGLGEDRVAGSATHGGFECVSVGGREGYCACVCDYELRFCPGRFACLLKHQAQKI